MNTTEHFCNFCTCTLGIITEIHRYSIQVKCFDCSEIGFVPKNVVRTRIKKKGIHIKTIGKFGKPTKNGFQEKEKYKRMRKNVH